MFLPPSRLVLTLRVETIANGISNLRTFCGCSRPRWTQIEEWDSQIDAVKQQLNTPLEKQAYELGQIVRTPWRGHCTAVGAVTVTDLICVGCDSVKIQNISCRFVTRTGFGSIRLLKSRALAHSGQSCRNEQRMKKQRIFYRKMELKSTSFFL